ncbi:related to Cell division control protein 11 [Hanseniaspora guilliermondii]|uniref:Related to Cell division control protein 11 n=1 Tax=Hanseniaspora guilliermondii TaxID=56406 RepID=A0A1L0B4V3_9ASCO|nr:related to Cell division control protein 11 [Hanseniaspora guilliermondii]
MSSILAANSDFRKKKQLKRSIVFNLLIAGKPGSGRSTLINSLCGRNIVQGGTSFSKLDKFYNNQESLDLEDISKNEIPVSLRHEIVELEDDHGIKIQLNLTDTINLNNNLNSQPDIELIKNFITSHFDDVLLEENRLKRNPRFKDSRIHVCLYLIEPTGHGLKEFDIEFMKNIGERCNVLPIICKSDTLTEGELKLNKRLIIEDIKYHNIPIYDFVATSNGDDDEEYEYNEYLNGVLPFSVIGSNEIYQVNNEEVRGRKYEHFTEGNIILDIEDATKSDFVTLRNVLFISHLNDFKEYTHEILYEKYRTETLSGSSNVPLPSRNYKPSTAGSVNETKENSNNENLSMEEQSVEVDENGDNSYLAKEEQIRLEEEKLKQFELRIQNELLMKRQELLKREEELRQIEKRLELEAQMK